MNETESQAKVIDSLTENLHSAGWSYGYCRTVDQHGALKWLADAHKGEHLVRVAARALPEALRELWKVVEPLSEQQEGGGQ